MRTALFAFAFFLAASGQDTVRPTLQITIDGWGDVWPQGKHNYLTVWPDGKVQYLQKSKRGLTAQVTDGINKARLEQLEAVSREVVNAKTSEGPSSHPLDYRMTVHIETARGNALDIPRFDFDRPDQVPVSVYRLLCLADSIRDEPYRLTKPANCSTAPK